MTKLVLLIVLVAVVAVGGYLVSSALVSPRVAEANADREWAIADQVEIRAITQIVTTLACLGFMASVGVGLLILAAFYFGAQNTARHIRSNVRRYHTLPAPHPQIVHSGSPALPVMIDGDNTMTDIDLSEIPLLSYFFQDDYTGG
jgi:hypothetical protein